VSVRVKGSGKYQYLEVVHNKTVNGKVRQEVIATLGRFDVLQKTGQIDGLMGSFLSSFAAVTLIFPLISVLRKQEELDHGLLSA